MANVLEIVVRAKDLASDVIRGVKDATDEAVEGMESSWSKLSGIGKAAGVAAGGALAAGAVIGVSREATGDKIAAQVRLSPDEQKKAGAIAGKVYADAYGESFEQVQETVALVGETLGVSLSDTSAVEKLSQKALDLATAFDLDVSEAVTRAGILMETGLARDADHAMDLIAASMQDVAPGLRDELGEATTEYSKFFADLGFTGEETFGLLAAADDKFSLDKTGDAIKELSIRATDGSTATKEAFAAMGMNAELMAQDIARGGEDARAAFNMIVNGLLDIKDPAERAQTAVALFGTPLEDLSVAQIPEFLESLQNTGGGLEDVEGRAEELGETLNDNAQTKIESYKRAIEGVLENVVNLPGPLGGAAAAVGAMGQVAGPMAPLLGVLATQTGLLSGVTRGLGAAFNFVAANPIVLIIGALVALGAGLVALYNNSETFRNFVLSVWEAIQNAIKWAWENVISPVWEAIKAGMSFLIELGKMYMEAWMAVFRAIGDWIREVWSTRIKPTWDLFKAGIDSLVSFARNLRDRWSEFWSGIGSKVKDIWNNTVKPTWEFIKDGIDSVRETAETLGEKWGEIWDGIKTAVKNTVNAVIGFINGAIGAVEKLINALANGINNLPKFTIPDWVPGIGGNTFGLPHVPTVSLPRIPQLAGGGIVKARPGGMLAVIGEGGRDERVSPIGGPDDPMVQVVMLLKELIKAVRESRSLSVDGRELAGVLGGPFVEEIRARTGL